MKNTKRNAERNVEKNIEKNAGKAPKPQKQQAQTKPQAQPQKPQSQPKLQPKPSTTQSAPFPRRFFARIFSGDSARIPSRIPSAKIFSRILASTFSSLWRARAAFVTLCYVVIFFALLPRALESLANLDSSASDYAALIFLPIAWLTHTFSANFIGVLALFVFGALGATMKPLRHFTILFVIYLFCAYPSFLYGGFIPSFSYQIIEAVVFLGDESYAMLLAFYARLAVKIFAIFAIFDIAYFLLTSRQNPKFTQNPSLTQNLDSTQNPKVMQASKFTHIPKFAWYNLIFTLILYAFVVVAYSLHDRKMVWF
ncbi:hypothetical protein BKN38_04285 [Helicobacter sp. CLO-3]|uniref:hypothetical protein n=1 Tax=unclassified Helicobacter TaxID=2593540 RepID=UPI0008052963|nr:MULTISPECIES: hypothetical protein [unclassified Helicobacter]OBV29191.1 hypothetical protein BA723_00940 [Helicobacter sp. CLO-3]OHU84022.1 hypothetical protein BKN38_04285 [Helicobacter sp. CLO-3]